MIVKVQWPITGEPVVLVYSQDRSICDTFAATDDIKEMLFGDKEPTLGVAKQYFNARISRKNNLVLLDKAPDQCW